MSPSPRAAPPTDAVGTDAVELVARLLPQRTALFSRLFRRCISHDITRSESALLATLAEGPRRITELAELEGLAQPTVTLLVKRLEERNWVHRDRDSSDGRAVQASLTPVGREVLDGLRSEYRSALREHLARLPAEQVEALVDATEALVPLIESLQRGARR